MFAGAREQNRLSVRTKRTDEGWIHTEVKDQVLQMKKGQREEDEGGERY